MFGIDDIVAAALPLVNGVMNRVWPDPADQAKAALAIQQMQQTGELAFLASQTDLAKAQIATNTAEATNASVFVSGWRPMVGWCCAAGVGTQFLIAPLATWVLALFGKSVVFPPLDMGTLIPLLAGMLGIGAMRTVEKISGVTK